MNIEEYRRGIPTYQKDGKTVGMLCETKEQCITDDDGVELPDKLAGLKAYTDAAYANSNLYTDEKIAELINGAPTTLDTLKEVADAMGENADVVEALNEAVGSKVAQAEYDGHANNDTIHITAEERERWNNNSGSGGGTSQETIDNIINGTTAVGNALKLNGLKVEEFVSNGNLLINPELEVGATDITNKTGGTTAIASKWNINAHSNITYSAEHTENGLKITAQNGTDGGWLNFQQVHTDFVLEDGTYTLSFYCDKPENIKQCGISSTHATVTGGGRWFNKNGNIVWVNIKVSNSTGVSVFIQLLNEPCDVTIKWVKLERGSVATPFIPPNKEVEKLKCSIVDMPTHWATDLNAEFGLGFKVCKYNNNTLNTPYTEGITGTAVGGECMTFGFSSTFGMQLAMPAGYKKLCIRNITDGTFGEWSNSADGGNANTVGGKHASDFLSREGGTIEGRVDVKRDSTEVMGVTNTNGEPVTIGFTGASGKKGSFGFMSTNNPTFWKSDGTTLGHALHTGNSNRTVVVDTDPGVGVSVDYPDGTLIFVKE